MTGAFDGAIVDLRDGLVRWRVIRERSVLRLEASPEFDQSRSYDADLLGRFLGGERQPQQRATPEFANRLKRFLGFGSRTPQRASPGSLEALREMMSRTVEDVIQELEQLRQPIAAAFTEATWAETRRELADLGRRRDAELFGRPYSPTDK